MDVRNGKTSILPQYVGKTSGGLLAMGDGEILGGFDFVGDFGPGDGSTGEGGGDGEEVEHHPEGGGEAFEEEGEFKVGEVGIAVEVGDDGFASVGAEEIGGENGQQGDQGPGPAGDLENDGEEGGDEACGVQACGEEGEPPEEGCVVPGDEVLAAGEFEEGAEGMLDG